MLHAAGVIHTSHRTSQLLGCLEETTFLCKIPCRYTAALARARKARFSPLDQNSLESRPVQDICTKQEAWPDHHGHPSRPTSPTNHVVTRHRHCGTFPPTLPGCAQSTGLRKRCQDHKLQFCLKRPFSSKSSQERDIKSKWARNRNSFLLQ